MKVLLDRRSCKCWDAACESHFGWHFLREEISPIDCVLEMVDDGQEEISFFIKDHDGTEKVLIVDEKNRAEAMDSWLLAWEKQQENK
jgi:hypothetical protein